MSIYEFTSYKDYVLHRVQSEGKRGALRKVAAAIGTNSSMVSQIFRGHLDLNPDQAIALTDHLGLTEAERDYFMILVQLERAATPRLRKHLQSKLEEGRKAASLVRSYVSKPTDLSESDQAEFYSDWSYSAIRLATSLPGLDRADEIATRFRFPVSKVRSVLAFLESRGLCVEENGRYGVGISKTHLKPDSPHISRHHSNWRLKAMQKHPILKDSELAFSSPMTLSREDFARVRQVLLETIRQTHQILAPSENEMLACMNIDWFEVD